MFHWRVFILFILIVLIPAIIVGISNWHVFPDSFVSATLMLILTVGVAGVFSYFAGDATPKISRYCIVATIVVAVILCANLAGHWLLAREVSAARQGVEERHTEEDRAEGRRRDKVKDDLALLDAETRAAQAERRRLAQLPPEERRSALRGKSQKAADAESSLTATPEVKAARMTPDQVREKWWAWLTALAIAEVAASVLGGSILAGIWEWDRDGDGIADHLQQPGRAPSLPARNTPGFAQAQDKPNPKAQSDQDQ